MKARMFAAALKLVVGVALIGCATYGVKEQATVTKQQVPLTYVNASYGKLGSEAFVSDYAGKGVSFRAMFIGEWTITQAYEMGGINTKGRVFINHRDTSYLATETGLGSSDMAFPEFALSIEKEKSDIIYESKRGDIFEIKGLAQKAGMPGKKGLHILIHEIRKVTRAKHNI